MWLIGAHCPTEILFCGNDHWSPEFHMKDLFKLQTQGVVPLNIRCTFRQELRHDFVVVPEMVADVKAYCLDCILKTTTRNAANITRMPVSRLWLPSKLTSADIVCACITARHYCLRNEQFKLAVCYWHVSCSVLARKLCRPKTIWLRSICSRELA